MRAVWRSARPNTARVDRPPTTSRNPRDSAARLSHCRRCTAAVAMPMSAMKIGMSGSTITSTRPDNGSAIHAATTHIGVATAVSTSCGR